MTAFLIKFSPLFNVLYYDHCSAYAVRVCSRTKRIRSTTHPANTDYFLVWSYDDPQKGQGPLSIRRRVQSMVMTGHVYPLTARPINPPSSSRYRRIIHHQIISESAVFFLPPLSLCVCAITGREGSSASKKPPYRSTPKLKTRHRHHIHIQSPIRNRNRAAGIPRPLAC